MINIVVQGPDKSGKGHIIAAISRALTDLGCDITVQGAETHNAPKMTKNEEELKTRLQGLEVRISEQQTAL